MKIHAYLSFRLCLSLAGKIGINGIKHRHEFFDDLSSLFQSLILADQAFPASDDLIAVHQASCQEIDAGPDPQYLIEMCCLV